MRHQQLLQGQAVRHLRAWTAARVQARQAVATMQDKTLRSHLTRCLAAWRRTFASASPSSSNCRRFTASYHGAHAFLSFKLI